MHASRPYGVSTSSGLRNAHPVDDIIRSNVSAETSYSSNIVVPEFSSLSSIDVDIIDSIVERAGPTATSFLPVFKAYSDVLQERGINSKDVLYYGKILKLGTLRGKNWKDKWDTVKAHFGYGEQSDASTIPPSHNQPSPSVVGHVPRSRVSARSLPTVAAGYAYSERSEDSGPKTSDSEAKFVQQLRQRPQSPVESDVTESSLGFEFENHPLLSTPTKSSTPPGLYHKIQQTQRPPRSDSFSPPISIPPSYHAAVHKNLTTIPAPFRGYHKLGIQKSALGSSALSKDLTDSDLSSPPNLYAPKKRRGSVINTEDAFTNIKVLRYEKEADQFRREKLLERCMGLWRQGLEWILATNDQVGQAADAHLLRVHIHRWREQLASRRDLYVRVSAASDNRCLKITFIKWKSRLKRREHAKVRAEQRQSIRAKMKTIQQRRVMVLRQDAWTRWRESFRLSRADDYFSSQLLRLFFSRWQNKLNTLAHLDEIAQQFDQDRSVMIAERCWEYWMTATRMAGIERTVSLRIIDATLQKWKRRLNEIRTADAYHNFIVIKNALGAWKRSRDRIQMREARADRILAKQDTVLLRAVMRVWKAKERGRLFERIRMLRILTNSFSAWKSRIDQQQNMQVIANTFHDQCKAMLVPTVLNKWQKVFLTHKNSQAFAATYYYSHLQVKIISQWKKGVVMRMRLERKAAAVDNYIILRRAWRTLKFSSASRKKTRLLRQFELQKVKKNFEVWRVRLLNQRQMNMAKSLVEHSGKINLLRKGLTTWTNRVINMRLRQLEVAQRYDNALLTKAFVKWTCICKRHANELGLMQSYQDVKREENVRRMFYLWLTAAKKSRERSAVLREHEQQIKITTIATAWDKWRERFCDGRLRPFEVQFLIGSQKGMMSVAFGAWHSKTKSLPAIRYSVSHTKARAWYAWRALMPQALLAKKAKMLHQKYMLSRYLEKWSQTYRTKVTLKAVARARYLRIPTATPSRPPLKAPLALRASSSKPRIFPSRDESEAEESDKELAVPRWGSSYARKPRSTASSPSRSQYISRTREPSPARSSYSSQRQETGTGSEIGRTSLWQELRHIQQRSRPASKAGSSMKT